MNIRDAYSDWAATYDDDRNLTRDLDQEVTRTVLSEARCESILEIGCGTGKNTAFLAQFAKRVLAVDFSTAMIQKAQVKLRSSNVRFAVANITQSWPCRDRSVDLISCNLVLEHVSDLSFIFAESFRVLTEPGRLFISELHPFRQYEGVQAKFQHEGQTNTIPAFVHHISDFTNAAAANRLSLLRLNEWWHQEDKGKPPRLISFLFEKQG